MGAPKVQPIQTTEPRSGNALRGLARRVALTAAALGVWFWTQHLIGSRNPSGPGIGDGLHAATASWNLYLVAHPSTANALLIVSSFFIDAMALFLLARWLFGPTVRPFLGLVILLGLRQLTQALVSLPAPPNSIWHYPGFPSLLVTYDVANDYFFSGHTAIAVFAAMELARLRRTWITVSAVALVIFEVLTVLVLRAHYTMDVFTGMITALLVAECTERIAPKLDAYIAGTSSVSARTAPLVR